ncbi:MAG: methylglutaconyl-CoA hydratase [Lentisphaeria bacterium]|jgi:methylglutaconyl-CoA hydratase
MFTKTLGKKMTTNTVLMDVDQRGVATVTLNRAEKHNALNAEMVALLHKNFVELSNTRDIRLLVLAANGKTFSSGADLESMRSMAGFSLEKNQEDARALADMLHTLNFLSISTIAKVQGSAFGGALGLISCCDMAVSCSMANFSLSETKLGLVPAVISPYVVAAIGQRFARRYFQSAEVFDAERGFTMGLLSEVVCEDSLDKKVEQLITVLLKNGPAAMREAKQLVFDVSNAPITNELIEHTSNLIAALRVSKEGQEGLTAFLEKRSPAWVRS